MFQRIRKLWQITSEDTSGWKEWIPSKVETKPDIVTKKKPKGKATIIDLMPDIDFDAPLEKDEQELC